MPLLDLIPTLPAAGTLAGTEKLGVIGADGLPVQTTAQAVADLAPGQIQKKAVTWTVADFTELGPVDATVAKTFAGVLPANARIVGAEYSVPGAAWDASPDAVDGTAITIDTPDTALTYLSAQAMSPSGGKITGGTDFRNYGGNYFRATLTLNHTGSPVAGEEVTAGGATLTIFYVVVD